MADRSDVLVLGGGIVGLACAHYLQQAGRRVTVLEARSIGSGSSHGNCGTITPSHAPPLTAPGQVRAALQWMLTSDAPFYVKPRFDPELWAWLLRFAARCNPRDFAAGLRAKAALLIASRTLLAGLVREQALDCEFAESGTLFVFRTAQAFERAALLVPQLREAGIEVETLDGAAARALEPALNDSIVGAQRYPGDARLRPDRFVAELARVVRAGGARMVENALVSGFETGDGRVLAAHTSAGTFRGAELVLAAGAWSPQVAKPLRLHLPIQPGKGYSITYSCPRVWPRIPLSFKERAVCATGWASGFRLGSTMEFSGYDATLNRTRIEALKRAAREYLIEPEGPQVTEEWYGWRPMVYDDLPLIGRANGWQNLWLATGHGMLGVSNAAITGRLIADMIEGRDPVIDPAPYSPARFA